MLLAFAPSTNVNSPIAVSVLALAMESVFRELTSVLDAVWPRKFAEAFHFAVDPLAVILLAISPAVSASPFDNTFSKLSCVV